MTCAMQGAHVLAPAALARFCQPIGKRVEFPTVEEVDALHRIERRWNRPAVLSFDIPLRERAERVVGLDWLIAEFQIGACGGIGVVTIAGIVRDPGQANAECRVLQQRFLRMPFDSMASIGGRDRGLGCRRDGADCESHREREQRVFQRNTHIDAVSGIRVPTSSTETLTLMKACHPLENGGLDMLLIQSELTERREPIPQILRIMGGSCREKIDKQARLCAVLTIQKMGRV